MKKSSAKIGKSQGLHFHPIVSVIALVLGILGTIFVTHVLAQTANNIIYACVNNSSGILRIVTSTIHVELARLFSHGIFKDHKVFKALLALQEAEGVLLEGISAI